MNSPTDTLKSFLFGLPDTIRASVFALVVSYAGEFETLDGMDEAALRDAITSYLAPANPFREVGAVLAMSAFVDQVLGNWIEGASRTKAAIRQMIAEHPENPRFKKLALGDPLRERHTQQAFERWNKLRDGDLSRQALSTFLDEQIRPRVPE